MGPFPYSPTSFHNLAFYNNNYNSFILIIIPLFTVLLYIQCLLFCSEYLLFRIECLLFVLQYLFFTHQCLLFILQYLFFTYQCLLFILYNIIIYLRCKKIYHCIDYNKYSYCSKCTSYE